MGSNYFYTNVDALVNKLAQRFERSLVICEDNIGTIVEGPESSDCIPNVISNPNAPNIVVGSNKKNRRPCPQTHSAADMNSLSDSDDAAETLDKGHRNCCAFSCCHQNIYRSTTQIDIPINKSRRLLSSDDSSKLKRCASLMTFKKTKPAKEALAQQQQQTGSTAESLESTTHVETLEAVKIINIWERARISNGKGILLALGFDEDEVNLAQLSNVLEEEVRHLENDPQIVFLRAAHALQSAELTTVQQLYRQIHEESTKLRTDNKATTVRARKLAAEIAVRHASLENSFREELKALEQQHAVVVHDLLERLATDSHDFASLKTTLESEINRFEKEEISTKKELELVVNENNELKTKVQELQNQNAALLSESIQLKRKVAELLAFTRCEVRASSPNESLMDKLDILEADFTKLRYKNQELVTELKNVSSDLAHAKLKNEKSLSLNKTNEQMPQNESNGDGTTTIAPSNKHIAAETPQTGIVSKVPNTTSALTIYDGAGGDCLPLHSEQQNDCKHVKELKMTISVLENQLENLLNLKEANSNITAFVERNKNLENCLEQMERAYEDCEDYWQSKLAQERKSFEKERLLFEKEQSEKDDKVYALLDKIKQYEDELKRTESLPSIGENKLLEEQYSYLENEFKAYKQNTMNSLEDKRREIEKLRKHNIILQLQLVKRKGIDNSQNLASSPIT